VELQIAAQFDMGHYRLIRLTDPHGAVLVEQTFTDPDAGAPAWFSAMIPIHANPGTAQVTDGWNQYGTLTLESHSRYAYAALWDGTRQLLLWFLLGGLVTGVIGTLIIKYITRPLGRVVEQAEAIGGRRFVTTPEPSTTEFRSLVRAMNTLSERVRLMLADESRRLEQLRRQSQHDELTGLLNRGQFLNRLDSMLSREDTSAEGGLLLARLRDLGEVNRQLGHQATDTLLRDLAAPFAEWVRQHPNWEAGRLNASDFALLAPGAKDLGELTKALAGSLHQVLDADPARAAIGLPLAATAYAPGETHTALLARLDGALAAAELAGDRAVQAADPAVPTAHADLYEWRTALLKALDDPAGLRLGRYPVAGLPAGVLHYEAPARLLLDGEWRTAGYFMPWASRLGLMPRVDATVARKALQESAAEGVPLGINLSSTAICDAGFVSELFALLRAAPEAARQLAIEVPEYEVLRHLPEFRALCAALRPLGCKFGIKHVGPRFSRIENLHELGLDYLKIDAAIIRGIAADPGNQSFLRGLCVVAHSIGLLVIAEGVASAAELGALPGLGVDGMTGPGVGGPV
jgi:diguanylate cyclase (GGDEF)-like protein